MLKDMFKKPPGGTIADIVYTDTHVALLLSGLKAAF